jgi:hypothetical protein
MNIQRFELIATSTRITLRGISPDTEKGYFNIESVANITGKSIPKLRKAGQKRAKHFNVPFVEIDG